MNATRHRIRARRPSGIAGSYARLRSQTDIASYLEDAAHYPGGACSEVCLPVSEADVADVLRSSEFVLPVGVQSSLTGGATPQRGVVMSTDRMRAILGWTSDAVRVQAGCALAVLEEQLAERGLYYPPAPTYDGATVGGTASTNAAGAATFKYGTTRDWVRAATVVLADGDVLELQRGAVCASVDGVIELEKTDGEIVGIRLPTYTMPDVPKRSAGYFARPGMDLIDLFIGSEGTLGVIVDLELELKTPRPAWLVGLVQCADDAAAISLVGALRSAAEIGSVDVAAIEYMDARCLDLLREDGYGDRLGFVLDPRAAASVLYQVEVDSGMSQPQAERALADALESGNGPFAALAVLLQAHDALESSVHALPGDDRRRRALFALREAVPEAVNRRIKQAQREIDPAISKCAADVIVPFDRFATSLAAYRDCAGGLDLAIWGHISDGNVHPNILPRSAVEYEAARRALTAMGEAAIGLGGCPMSEHGVGRNPIKQALLERLYGKEGIDEMRSVKRALDPLGKLAPGVLFSQ